ncbi:MAG TPA: hypothetical protein ENN13_02395 [Candidatus Altiarchaeales archaeon]|nr:hypothetical protein [Candidatus Altiarchaeales archaeon]
MDGKTLLLLLILAQLATHALSEDCMDVEMFRKLEPTIEDIQTIGYALAVLMIGYQGLKWSASESDETREDAKRGIIYIIIGIFVLKVGGEFILYILCG